MRWLLALVLLPLVAQNPDHDIRNTRIRASRTPYSMPVFSSREAWEQRATFLRKQILASSGLLPMPTKTPLNAEVFGKLERDGYTIEKVLLETYPGFYLGGNLYRPRGKQGPFPAIVSPHGHWAYGRLENQSLVSVPGRCINLALQGFVVFSYDMIGYNDTNQAPHHWGEPRHELWSVGPMGWQLWNSIRAVDFVTSLPDVDESRIGATGASGGGTQTFLLMAVDPRIKAAAPVNMISASMQGGVCENAANLRVGGDNDTSNMVIGALMAPRPLLLVSATGDWTSNTPKVEFPGIRSIYSLLGAEPNIEQVQVDEQHNYNKPSREAVYRFFSEKLLGKPGPVPEKRFQLEQLGDLLALHGRQRPANAATFEELVTNWIGDSKASVETLRPRDRASLDKARAEFHERLSLSILASEPAPAEVIFQKIDGASPGQSLLLGRKGKEDRVPALWLEPERRTSSALPTLVAHPDGIAWVKASAQAPAGLVKRVLESGGSVLAVDLFQTGSAKAPRDKSNRAFTVFNQTDDANRVQDLLTALAYLRSRSNSTAVNVIGLEMAGVWTYFARALSSYPIHLAADLSQFRIDSDEEYLKRFFIPGIRKAGDFRAAAVLNARDRLLVHNTANLPVDWINESVRAAGVRADVRTAKLTESEIAGWINADR
jgi:dienelactone hydrolase